MKVFIKSILTLAIPAALLFGCEDERRGGGGGGGTTQKVDPSDPDALTSVIIIPGANNQQGNPPAPSTGNPNQPQIGNYQSSASITADNTLYLPFTFDTFGSGQGYAGCYVQIDGATSYFDIPANSATPANGMIAIPLTIPGNVDLGYFTVLYGIYDNAGLVSEALYTYVTIDSSQSCPSFASGSAGLTIMSVDLGKTAGMVEVDYHTYSVPDRVDVFYDGTWVGGTGSSLATGQFPPVSQCYDGEDGYVGEVGTIQFNYDGSGSGRLDVYMSGCLGGGTAWDVSVSCPE